MTILGTNFNDVGSTGQPPNIIRIDTDDTIDAVQVTGYLNVLAHQNLPLSENAIAVVSTGVGANKSTSVMRMVFSSGDWSLELLEGYQASLDDLSLPTATVVSADKVLIQDVSDGDKLKTVTAQSIADLGGGGSGVFNQVKVTVTSPQILDLVNTPVDLIPAPGAGKVILVSSFFTVQVAGTTPYTAGGVLALAWDGFDGISFYEEIPSTMVTVDNHITLPVPIDYPNNISQNLIVDTPISLYNSVAAFEDGDGTLDVYLTYQIVTL